MGKQIVSLALVFFAIVGIAAASVPAGAPSSNDGPISFNNDGGSSAGHAVDAAPVGGPVAAGVFPDLTPAVAPSVNKANALGATAVVGAVVGVASSFFL